MMTDMTRASRPRLLVVDVSDEGRDDPAFHAELRALTASVLRAADDAGFDATRVAAEAAGVEGLLAELERADAVVLTGGDDVDPAFYDGPAEYAGRAQTFPAADRAQIALVVRAVEARVPLVGICRGMQLVNVALGGDLVQHLPGDAHVRTGASDDSMVDHDVRLDPASDLAARLGGDAFDVRSSHHQAVARLGAGLTAVAWADDGTVEAVEHREAPLWCVQWHPEDSRAQGDVLTDLLEAARASVTAS
jgi:putative glutamine amidotransferase